MATKKPLNDHPDSFLFCSFLLYALFISTFLPLSIFCLLLCDPSLYAASQQKDSVYDQGFLHKSSVPHRTPPSPSTSQTESVCPWTLFVNMFLAVKSVHRSSRPLPPPHLKLTHPRQTRRALRKMHNRVSSTSELTGCHFSRVLTSYPDCFIWPGYEASTLLASYPGRFLQTTWVRG